MTQLARPSIRADTVSDKASTLLALLLRQARLSDRQDSLNARLTTSRGVDVRAILLENFYLLLESTSSALFSGSFAPPFTSF